MNGLTGSIPDKFAFTPSLSALYLDSNVLTGALPPSLTNSTTLVTVHLSNNSLSGGLAFPHAANLTALYVARNLFSGALSLGANRGLQKISVDFNQIDGALPDLGAFPGLVVFSAARNNFTGGVPGLANATNLAKLCVPDVYESVHSAQYFLLVAATSPKMRSPARYPTPLRSSTLQTCSCLFPFQPRTVS